MCGLQRLAPELKVLHALADALSGWAAGVSRAVQQRQLAGSKRQPDQMLSAASPLHDAGSWLPAGTRMVLHCMYQHKPHSAGNEQQLLHTLGQLLQQVLRWLLLKHVFTGDCFFCNHIVSPC